MFKLLKSDSPVTEADIEALEINIGFKLPADFKDFYMDFNGGSPSREFWAEDEDFEPIRVEDFKSISRIGASDGCETKYIGGCYRLMQEKKVLPRQLVPFANDEAGNFICIEKDSGRIIYFAVDVFQPDIDMHLNHLNAQRHMSDSFGEFIESLVDEDEVDF
ncbi:SMI1 / KNR4 family protein [compost metagenome]|uniref:SMI1/KNR4 family protein n=1 Tax=unclassified Pseudomonas TaxID=196821 RepID=UPI000C6E0950|nr:MULTISPECIES: SMI1/KNR4 family protein [unclassified Pseudomonas]QYX48281.1 SMI1/KNR4 family protein [Pseudomonas sp. S11A 273]